MPPKESILMDKQSIFTGYSSRQYLLFCSMSSTGTGWNRAECHFLSVVERFSLLRLQQIVLFNNARPSTSLRFFVHFSLVQNFGSHLLYSTISALHEGTVPCVKSLISSNFLNKELIKLHVVLECSKKLIERYFLPMTWSSSTYTTSTFLNCSFQSFP